MKSDNDVLLCDFCGNSQHVVKVMVQGNEDAAICDECIDLCNEIVAEKRGEAKPAPSVISVAKSWVSKAIRRG